MKRKDRRSRPPRRASTGAGAPRSAPSAASSEASVYDGSRLLGSIFRKPGEFLAVDVDGEKIAIFPTAREAMRAICRHATATTDEVGPAAGASTLASHNQLADVAT